MATVNKDFKIKSGLVVEGTTGTINGYDILTKDQASTNFIIDVIGGETLITSVESTQLEVVNGELNVKSGVFDVDGAAAAAETAANLYTDGEITTALSTAQGYADQAETDANSYTDTALQSYTTTANLDTTVDGYGYLKSADLAGYATETYVDTAEQDAISAAADYTNQEITTATSNLQSYADNAAGNAQSAAESYTDTAVANLVDGAPALLDTLNELAAAINDDASFASTIATSIGEKVAKSGDTMTGELVLAADPTQALAAATKQYVDSAASDAYNDAIATADGTAQTYANTAEQNAKNYADGLATNYDAAGAASTAETNANTYTDNAINALDTDDIEEGITNVYFTDGRAKDSAASLLTNATLTNITITGTGNGGLTITAENGVADSDTDDLTEGSTNLYFTDQRVLDATSNATSVEVQKLDISWVRREEAAYASVATASTATVHSFGTNEGSVKYLVRLYNNNKSHVTEVLATTDSDHNVAIVEYGTIYTSVNALGTVTVEWNASTSKYDLNVTTANNNTEVLVAATLLAYND